MGTGGKFWVEEGREGTLSDLDTAVHGGDIGQKKKPQVFMEKNKQEKKNKYL